MKPLAEYERAAGYGPQERSCWFEANNSEAIGVVLLIHGLNQKPSSWQEMIDLLNGLGLHVFRLTLKGHGGGGSSDMKRVTAGDWLENFNQGYCAITKRYPDLAKYLVAYSLGALVALESQMRHNKSLFAKQFLLAPAIIVKSYTSLVLWLCRVFPSWPSRTPRRYVANPSGTAAAAYRALFELLRLFSDHPTYHVLNQPTLIMMRRRDELVDYQGVSRFIADNNLTRWRLLTLGQAAAAAVDCSFKHLLVDERTAGPQRWDELTTALTEFIQADLPA